MCGQWKWNNNNIVGTLMYQVKWSLIYEMLNVSRFQFDGALNDWVDYIYICILTDINDCHHQCQHGGHCVVRAVSITQQHI